MGLDHYLNTAQFKGEAVKREALPEAGKAVTVGGVPFVLPAANERGRTHIDLKPSWLACGLAEGSWDPAYGDLARWQGATHVSVTGSHASPSSHLRSSVACEGESSSRSANRHGSPSCDQRRQAPSSCEQ